LRPVVLIPLALLVGCAGSPPGASTCEACAKADAGAPDAGPPDAGFPTSEWARYTIAPGAHSATVERAAHGNPKAALVSGLAGRDYQFIFDASAIYTLTEPVQPEDQLDWNKLPGLSDCNEYDLSVSGVMFGWRWRLDTEPQVLELTAYANDSGQHLTPAAPLVTLDAADLASEAPLRYRLWAEGALYHFEISGEVRGRAIDASATLPRQCPELAPAELSIQWAAGFYFGGTSTAPSTITGRVFELPFH